MILDALSFGAKRQLGGDKTESETLRWLILGTLDLWKRTLEELHAKSEVSGGGIRRQLEATAFAMCQAALEQIRRAILESSRPLDRAELTRICQFLEHGARTYLTALPKEMLDSPEAQKLLLSWALSMAAAWQAAEPARPPTTIKPMLPLQDEM